MVSLNRHMDFRGALAGELLAAAAQPPLPDAIRVVMLMGSPGARAPIETLAPGFACPPLMYGAPVPVRPRSFRRADIMEGEVQEEERGTRGESRRPTGHPLRARSGLRRGS